MTPAEIIKLLDGPTAIARMLDISAPSVCDWAVKGIPDGRLIELAARIEARSGGRFSRKRQWPERYAEIWPELASSNAPQVSCG
jgi:hypothetical protein